jgi:phosphohistidine phosphatase
VTPEAPKTASHVIVMRHAEAQRDFGGEDFDRPLTAEGRRQAQAAARAMHDAGHHPGPLLVSAAARARETADIMARELQIPASDIHVVDVLYEAPPELLEARIRVLAQPYTLVTLVAHNPGVTDLARFLAQKPDAPSLQPGEWRYLPWPPP